MSILPPLLPELDGSWPAAGSGGGHDPTWRPVVAIVGADETRHGRALLQGAPSLRRGAVLTLELQHAEPATAGSGRLVGVGQQRLESPLRSACSSCRRPSLPRRFDLPRHSKSASG